MSEPLLYELSKPGRPGPALPRLDVPASELPTDLLREDLPLPEVSEVDVVRHFVRLSQMNYAVDKGMYPLGSCTMKYNPKVNEVAARLPGFAQLHPLQPEETLQGALLLMYELQEMLKEIGGFAAVSLQPAAGAHGELTGVLMMRRYHLDRGETQRDTMLIPDSAHGTNPATSSMAGLKVIEIPSAGEHVDDRLNGRHRLGWRGDRRLGPDQPGTLAVQVEPLAIVQLQLDETLRPWAHRVAGLQHLPRLQQTDPPVRPNDHHVTPHGDGRCCTRHGRPPWSVPLKRFP